MLPLLLFLGLVLASCGGGGESQPVTVPGPAVPIAAPVIDVRKAFENFVHTGYDLPITIKVAQFAMTPFGPGNIVGYHTNTGRASATAGISSSFCTIAQSPPCPETWQVIKTQTGTNDMRVEYLKDTYTIVMTKLATPGQYYEGFVIFAPHTYPQTIQAGDTGTVRSGIPWDTEDGYRQGRSTLGLVTVTYSVESDGPNTLLVTFTEYNRSENYDEQEIISIYRVDTAGHLTPVSITNRRFVTQQTYYLAISTF